MYEANIQTVEYPTFFGTAAQGLDGLSTDECGEAVVRQLEAKEHGRKEINYRLRDWIFSRQRYWGEVRRTGVLC